MAIFLLFIFLAMVAVDIWAAIVVVFQHRLSGWSRSSYVIVTLLAFAAAFLVTSFFSYYSNPNTHVYGWPVPRVTFQRDTPTSPWLDYVGHAILLAYPMNFIVYMYIPSVAVIILAIRRRRHGLEAAAQQVAGANRRSAVALHVASRRWLTFRTLGGITASDQMNVSPAAFLSAAGARGLRRSASEHTHR